MSYTKLANAILTSTVWMEDHETRIVWLTLLAMADQHGEVQASIPGLANVARVDVPSCRKAILIFMSPDLDSRTKDDEGRRIVEIDGGWFIINHAKYRGLDNDDHRKQMAAERQKRYRDRHKMRDVTTELKRHSSHQNPQAEAEAEAEEQITIKEKGDSAKSPLLQNPEFAGVAEAFRKARTAKHGAVSEEVVEAWYYDLNRFQVSEAIEILRFSTKVNAKTPITNGDHKAKPPPERNGKPKQDTIADIIKKECAKL